MDQGRKITGRRMGPAGSANWQAMLDGAEEILREQGCAFLTSRAVAERIGVKQRLVYYYFAAMDDLIVETFRRLAVRELERLQAASRSERPLREIWDLCIHSGDARLITEFMALANRLPGLRAQVIDYIEEARRLQVRALEAAMERIGVIPAIAPAGLVLLATSAALLMNRETELGIPTGHAELASAIESFLAQAESTRARRSGAHPPGAHHGSILAPTAGDGCAVCPSP
jgi:AcrR family transcriptional regulator